jgi:DHA1 family tetracycline resistance protein-like MFS transporter
MTATAAEPPPKPRAAATAFILVTVVLDMLAFGMLAPVLPALLLMYSGQDAAAAAQHNGWLGTLWAAFQFFSMPFLGALSDRFGRRPVVLIANFGLALSFALIALAPNLAWLYVARIISGITAGNFATANAYIADVTPPEKRARAFGLISASFGIGFVIGPLVGGELGKIDPHLPFWVASGLCLLNACYGLFVLPESLPKEKRRPFKIKRANPLGAFQFLRERPALIGLAAVLFLSYQAHIILPSLFGLYVQAQFSWGPEEAGRALAIVGVASAIVGVGLVQPAVRILGERGALILGLLSGALGMTIFGLAPSGMVFLWALIPASLWGIAQPALQALMSKQVDGGEQGALQGANGSMRGLTDMIGPFLFSNLAFAWGVSNGVAGLPWLIAGALLFAGAGLAAVVTRPR